MEALWTDAVSGDGWVAFNELPETRLMRTRGWLVKEDETHIVLAGTLDADYGFYSETIAIPRGMIEVLHELVVT